MTNCLNYIYIIFFSSYIDLVLCLCLCIIGIHCILIVVVVFSLFAFCLCSALFRFIFCSVFISFIFRLLFGVRLSSLSISLSLSVYLALLTFGCQFLYLHGDQDTSWKTLHTIGMILDYPEWSIGNHKSGRHLCVRANGERFGLLIIFLLLFFWKMMKIKKAQLHAHNTDVTIVIVNIDWSFSPNHNNQ